MSSPVRYTSVCLSDLTVLVFSSPRTSVVFGFPRESRKSPASRDGCGARARSRESLTLSCSQVMRVGGPKTIKDCRRYPLSTSGGCRRFLGPRDRQPSGRADRGRVGGISGPRRRVARGAHDVSGVVTPAVRMVTPLTQRFSDTVGGFQCTGHSLSQSRVRDPRAGSWTRPTSRAEVRSGGR